MKKLFEIVGISAALFVGALPNQALACNSGNGAHCWCKFTKGDETTKDLVWVGAIYQYQQVTLCNRTNDCEGRCNQALSNYDEAGLCQALSSAGVPAPWSGTIRADLHVGTQNWQGAIHRPIACDTPPPLPGSVCDYGTTGTYPNCVTPVPVPDTGGGPGVIGSVISANGAINSASGQVDQDPVSTATGAVPGLTAPDTAAGMAGAIGSQEEGAGGSDSGHLAMRQPGKFEAGNSGGAGAGSGGGGSGLSSRVHTDPSLLGNGGGAPETQLIGAEAGSEYAGGSGGSKGGSGSGGGRLGMFSGLGGAAGSGSGGISGEIGVGDRSPASDGTLAMLSQDPDDYFNRIGSNESLFIKVERRYQSKSADWQRASVLKGIKPNLQPK